MNAVAPIELANQGRIAVRQHQLAAAPVELADHPLGVGEYRVVLGQQRRVEELGVAGHRPDGDGRAVETDVGQVGQVVDVDQHLGPGEPQLHHRQQAVAAGDEPGLRSVAFQQGERVVNGAGTLVVERRGCLHGEPP